MKKYFICLANSFKYGGRCLAGVEIGLSEDEEHFYVIYGKDGEPKWIRPMQRGAEHEAVAEETAKNIRLMDVIEIEIQAVCPDGGCQCENVYFNSLQIIRRLLVTDNILQALCSKRDYIIHNSAKWLSESEYRAACGSLMLVRPENPQIYKDYKITEDGKTVPKYKARFLYKDHEYDLPVTDPQYLFRMESYSRVPLIGQFPTGTFYFAVSIAAEPWNDKHYKLLAGIVDMRQAEDTNSVQNTDFHSLPYRLAEEFALKTNRPLFITGKAGTGKTTFLKKLKEQSPKTMAVAAPTGVAAINAGGMTIHSLFQLPVRTLIPTPQSYRQMFAEQRMTQRKRTMLYHLETLVIDEISMVRADVLDAIDAVLRHYKYRPNLPFGGVQVIMIGDLFQLSPVITRGDDETAMEKYYEGPYFFHARVMQQVQPVYIELDHVFRQQNADFVRLLNEVRENRLTQEGKEMLNSRYLPDFRNTDNDFHITLTTHNHTADALNEQELARLRGRTFTFKAEIVKEFPENNYPTDETLTLKEGARVMFIRNDDQTPRRFYNGKIGIVRSIEDDGITVACDDGDIKVGRMEWKNIRYREDEQTGRITEETLGAFVQYPLRLAWAVTIHKSQGLTFDRVIIDAARAFAAGQVYVALSRCRTLEGIVLSTPLQSVTLANDPQVIRYTQTQPALETVNQSLPQAQQEYRMQLFLSLFDFRRAVSLIENMQKEVAKAVSFNAETIPFLDQLKKDTEEILTVADRFQPQLQRLLLQNDTLRLQQRLQKAAEWFVPKLVVIAYNTSTLPVRCKNRADAADFQVFLNDFYLLLHKKICYMRAVSAQSTTEALLQAKSKFVCPPMEVQSVFDKTQKQPKKAKQPKTEKPAKPKKEKGETYKVTLGLYRAGHSPESIAVQRGLAFTTIYSHLARFVKTGEVDVRKIVPADTIRRIQQTVATHPDVSSTSDLYTLMNGEVDYGHIWLVMETMTTNQ